MRMRRRLAELEARIDTLESERFNGQMPTAPTIDSEPVAPLTLWRESVADYAAMEMEDVLDDRARPGVYL